MRVADEHREGTEAWLEQRMEPLRRTLERLSPRARAQFLEGWRILHEETGRIPGETEADCLE